MVRPSVELTLFLPSELGIIEPAVGYLAERCREFSFGGSRLELNFRVGVSEALANAVLYGNQCDPRKTVHVRVTLSEHEVVVQVSDEGKGFDFSRLPDPTAPENLHRSGGRGLFLIRKLMDETRFNDRGNSIRMVLLACQGDRPHTVSCS
jgi:serine/threonine-protein kinase RsbW